MSGSAWDRGSDTEPPSYVREMLFSQTNLNAFLASLAGGALLALPLGLAGFAIPLVLFGAGDAIAALFIPYSPKFRERIDIKHRRLRREAITAHLSREISRRTDSEDTRWGVHQRLRERAQSLREAKEVPGGAQITRQDVERMDDATLDYLALWLAALSLSERLRSLDERDLRRRLAESQKRLEDAPTDRTIAKAKADIEQLLERRQRLAARRTVVETALLALPDAVEEIFQAALTSPTAGEIGRKLQEAVDRLEVEEELEASFNQEMEELQPAARRRVAAKT
jgi:hypothetical protein